MTIADDYFSRVRPLLGTGLSGHAIEIDDGELGLLVVEMLAGCMLQDVAVTRAETLPALEDHLKWKQPFQPLRRPSATPDVRIRARRPQPHEGPAVYWRAGAVTMIVDPSDPIGWLDVSYHVARTLRDVLLHGAPWPEGPRYHGAAAWPFLPSRTPVICTTPDYASLRGRHIMVIGCGSVGSEAIRILDRPCDRPPHSRWTFVDDARVSVFNLARQWYGASEVGRYKVHALQQRIAGAHAWRTQLTVDELGSLEAMLSADRPDVVLLATGTHHHGLIGELLWRYGIPHVAACCYPQARFFEVSVVLPSEHTPCLHCFRGHLYSGAPEPAPISDEVASFLYQPMSDAERARVYTDLVAEPATRIETMRAAEVLARCAVEVCARRRSPWFQRVLDGGTTCLLGGNVVRGLPSGDYAYGIREPGQVIRLGVDDVAGTTESITCRACGRALHVTHRDTAPQPLDADVRL